MGIFNNILGKLGDNKKKDSKSKTNKKVVKANMGAKKVIKKDSKINKKVIKNKSVKNKAFKPLKKIKIDISRKTEKKIEKKAEEGFIQLHVPGFDELLNPGVPKGSAILVEGGPGSGKTLFCLTALRELCKRGKKVLYMSFEEPEERLREHIRSFGSNTEELEKKGLLYIKRFNALDIARSVEALLSEAKKELLIDVQPVLIPGDFKADVVLVDSLTSISSAFSGESSRFRIYMEQLFRYLESHNITSFLIREVASPTHIGNTGGREQEEAVSFLSDGIIAIYNVIYQSGERKRALEVLKMRGVEIKRRIVEYDITKMGVIVHPDKLITGDYKLT